MPKPIEYSSSEGSAFILGGNDKPKKTPNPSTPLDVRVGLREIVRVDSKGKIVIAEAATNEELRNVIQQLAEGFLSKFEGEQKERGDLK